MKSEITIEICVDSLSSATAAINGGADRLEVCSALEDDGLTPTTCFIQEIQAISQIPQVVMIRPRPGGFVYSDDEFGLMKQQLLGVKAIGVQGIVSGILTAQGEVDVKRTKELIRLAHPMQFVFHRAFDEVEDQFIALQKLIDLGVTRVLTSGGKPTAYEGKARIRDFVQLANNNIEIIAGSGINESNVADLIKDTAVSQIHSSASEKIQIVDSSKFKRHTVLLKVQAIKKRIHISTE